MNSKDIGEMTEAQVLAALLRVRKVVLKPFGDNQRYDLVIDDDGAFLRVQCKTGRLIKGVIQFATSSSYAHRGRGRRGYVGEAEFFGVYCPETDKVYMIPLSKVSDRRRMLKLRVDPTKNGQKKKVLWAKDYEITVG